MPSYNECDYCGKTADLYWNEAFDGSLCEDCDRLDEWPSTSDLSHRIETATEILKTMGQTITPVPEGIGRYSISDDFRVELNDNAVIVEAHFYTSEYSLPEEYDAAKLSYDRLRSIRRAIGGKWDKDYVGSTLQFIQERQGVTITLECDRGATCKRIVKGVREVPAQNIPARVIPARTEEIVEWECD